MGQNASGETNRRGPHEGRSCPYDPPPSNNPDLFLLEQEHRRERVGSFGNSRKKDRYVLHTHKQEKFSLETPSRQRPSSESEHWISMKDTERLKRLSTSNESTSTRSKNSSKRGDTGSTKGDSGSQKGNKNVATENGKNVGSSRSIISGTSSKDGYQLTHLKQSPRQGKKNIFESELPVESNSLRSEKGSKKDANNKRARSSSFSGKDEKKDNEAKDKYYHSQLTKHSSFHEMKNGNGSKGSMGVIKNTKNGNNKTNVPQYANNGLVVVVESNKLSQPLTVNQKGTKQARVKKWSRIPVAHPAQAKQADKQNDGKNVMAKNDKDQERLAWLRLETYRKKKAKALNGEKVNGIVGHEHYKEPQQSSSTISNISSDRRSSWTSGRSVKAGNHRKHQSFHESNQSWLPKLKSDHADTDVYKYGRPVPSAAPVVANPWQRTHPHSSSDECRPAVYPIAPCLPVPPPLPHQQVLQRNQNSIDVDEQQQATIKTIRTIQNGTIVTTTTPVRSRSSSTTTTTTTPPTPPPLPPGGFIEDGASTGAADSIDTHLSHLSHHQPPPTIVISSSHVTDYTIDSSTSGDNDTPTNSTHSVVASCADSDRPLVQVASQDLYMCVPVDTNTFILKDQNRNKTTKSPDTTASSTTSTKRASNQPDVVTQVVPPGAAAEIGRLEALCETRTKQLNVARIQLRTSAQGFDAMTVLVKYLTDELDAFSCPEVTAKLKTVKGQLADAQQQIDLLAKEKATMEKSLGDLKVQHAARLKKSNDAHQLALQQLQQRLTAEKDADVEKVAEQYSTEVTTLKTFLEKNISDMKSKHEKTLAEHEELRDKAAEKYKEDYEERCKEETQDGATSDCMEKVVSVEPGSELTKQHERRLEEITRTFENIKVTLSEKVETLCGECEEMRSREANLEARTQRESDMKIHIALMRYKHLPAEIESLKAVMEMRNQELHELRRRKRELEKEVEEVPVARKKIITLQQNVENLEALIQLKADYEKQLAEKHQLLLRKFDKEYKANKRLSMDNEELAWRLSNSAESPDLLRRSISHSPTRPTPPEPLTEVVRRRKSPACSIPTSPRNQTEFDRSPVTLQSPPKNSGLKRSGTYELLNKEMEDKEKDMKQSDV